MKNKPSTTSTIDFIDLMIADVSDIVRRYRILESAMGGMETSNTTPLRYAGRLVNAADGLRTYFERVKLVITTQKIRIRKRGSVNGIHQKDVVQDVPSKTCS